MSTANYYAEAEALEKSYREAVGWALQYGIKVYYPGGQPKSLGDLRDEITEYESASPVAPAPCYARTEEVR